MSETWNAEKQAYADCEGCHGKGWFDNGAVIVEPCNVCLPRRIAELEAALRPFAAIGEVFRNRPSLGGYGVDLLEANREDWIRAADALARLEGEAVKDESHSDTAGQK